MMKKFTSFLLIAALLAFMFSFSVTVFADYETDGGYEEIQIYGSESDGDYAKNEKSVKIFDLKRELGYCRNTILCPFSLSAFGDG